MKPFWFGKVRISTTLTIWNLIKNKHVNYRRHDAEENNRDLVKIGMARLWNGIEPARSPEIQDIRKPTWSSPFWPALRPAPSTPVQSRERSAWSWLCRSTAATPERQVSASEAVSGYGDRIRASRVQTLPRQNRALRDDLLFELVLLYANELWFAWPVNIAANLTLIKEKHKSQF